MQKKEWRKPELIVLVRNKPEEDVLVACKSSAGGAGPSNRNSACRNNNACTSSCSAQVLS